MKKLWFFTGQNINAKREESRQNQEFILANKENLPTLQEAIEAYKKCRMEWNEAPYQRTGKPRLEMYLESENPQTPELSMFDMVDLFWILRDKPVTYSASGLSFKEKKVQYDYVVYDENRSVDMEFHRSNIDKKFHIKFDPEDMSLIYLYEKTPLGLRFVTAAETKTAVSRARQDINEFEDKFIKEMAQKNKQSRIDTRDQTERILEQFGATAEQRGLNRAPLKGIESAKRKKKQSKKTTKPDDIAMHQKQLSEVVVEDDDVWDMV